MRWCQTTIFPTHVTLISTKRRGFGKFTLVITIYECIIYPLNQNIAYDSGNAASPVCESLSQSTHNKYIPDLIA